VVNGPLGCKLLVAGLGQLARVRVLEYQQVKSPGWINPLDFLGTSLKAESWVNTWYINIA